MNLSDNSDIYNTMAAKLKFEEILGTIQSSNLNFRLEISPFSAIIHMKKSLVTNKFGISLFPPPAYSILLEQEKSHNMVLSQRIVVLENQLKTLKDGYEEALLVRDEALESVVKLENELKTAQSETSVKKENILANVKNETAEEDLTKKAEMK